MATTNTSNLYVTTFCNKPHLISDGAPFRHECYQLNPAAIRAEMDDTVAEYLASGAPVHNGKAHKGVKSFEAAKGGK